MPTMIPAVRGKFGTTEYFLTTMKAGEVVDKLRVPKELPEWADMTIEERFQREINWSRVKKHIAPYLVNDDDRFFGALIVDMYNSEGVVFEPIEDVIRDLPVSYRTSGRQFGFLHLLGGEVLVPLDGQHRLAAFRFAITGKDEKQANIKDLSPNLGVANDDVTVILLKHDERKARKIFNKVNRYAKKTSKAENLITADDDIVAVITRGVANEKFSERLVNYQSNTLSATTEKFTTLSTLYDCNMKILESKFGKINTTVLPDKYKIPLYEDEVENTWETLLNGINLFRDALQDQSEAGDTKRVEIRKDFLLGKPIVQLSLVMAYIRLAEAERSDGSKFQTSEIVQKLNALDWRFVNPGWQRVLLNGERIVAGKQAALFASRFIAYLAGEPLDSVEKKALLENYRSNFSKEERDNVLLPERTL